MSNTRRWPKNDLEKNIKPSRPITRHCQGCGDELIPGERRFCEYCDGDRAFGTRFSESRYD
jgi:rRNA maturation endonuclease Nob1